MSPLNSTELKRLINAGSLFLSAKVAWEVLTLILTGIAAVAVIKLLLEAKSFLFM